MVKAPVFPPAVVYSYLLKFFENARPHGYSCENVFLKMAVTFPLVNKSFSYECVFSCDVALKNVLKRKARRDFVRLHWSPWRVRGGNGESEREREQIDERL